MSCREELARLASESPEETIEIGRRLGALLGPGQGIALRGELGAGKTVFVRGLARGLAVDEPDEVRSPTYLLMVEHPGRVPLLHLDAYFADRSTDFLVDGGEAYLQEGGVLVVEWAERLGVPLPEDFLEVEIRHRGPTARRLVFRGRRPLWGDLVQRLSATQD